MEIEYGQLVKIYGNGQSKRGPLQPCRLRWRSQGADFRPTRLRARFPPVYRTPEPHHPYEGAPIHRLINAFSKKVENHEAAIALHYMYYNFARVHQSLRVTPAMEAGISVHFWTLQEIVALL